MPPTGRMRHLITVQGSFHGRVIAARLGAEGILVDLRGLAEGPYPLQGAVEILVAELGRDAASHQLYHIAYDGTVVDEVGYACLGGDADTITARLSSSYREDCTLAEAVSHCVEALAGPDRTLGSGELEAAVLEEGPDRRAFRRLRNGELAELLGEGGEAPPAGGSEEG